jgi:hypothetical protein
LENFRQKQKYYSFNNSLLNAFSKGNSQQPEFMTGKRSEGELFALTSVFLCTPMYLHLF